MLDIEIFTDKVPWDAFVAGSPQYNLFCMTPFLDAWGRDYDLIAVRDNQSIMLGAIIVKDEDGRPVSAPFMYHGVLVGRAISNYPTHKRLKKTLELVDELLAWLSAKYDRISFSQHHSFEDLRGFQWFHYHKPEKGLFRLDIRYSALLDLSHMGGMDEVIAGVRTVRRQEYRRCLKEGYVIEEVDSADALNQLHAMTFERQGLQRSKSEEFMATGLAQTAVEQGFGRILLCKSADGAAASASLFLFDEKSAYYLIGANNPAHRNSGSGTLVVLEQIRRSMEQGVTSIDFVGANSPHRGDFKTSFNARLVQYVDVAWEGNSYSKPLG